MGRGDSEVYDQHRKELAALLAERGRRHSSSYDSDYSYATIAVVGTAVQMAVRHRLAAGRSGAQPFSTASELRMGASEMRLPPAGESVRIGRNALEALVSQPSRFNDRLGPVSGAANRTIGWGMRNGLLVPPASLITITRTIEQKHLRRTQTLGARSDNRLDLAAVVGPIPHNGGAAFVHATHPHLQSPDDAPAELIAYHQTASKIKLNPLALRLWWLRAVWLELRDATGISIPVVQRAERRFDQPDEGSLTSDQLWFATDQPNWSEEVSAFFDDDVVVLGESREESLRGASYVTKLGERRLGNPGGFLRDIEMRLPSLMVANLPRSQQEGERTFGQADDVVRLEGHILSRDGSAYRPVVVLSHPHAVSVMYLIPAKRAAAMEPHDWEAACDALAPLHGAANGRSSDDQGLGLTMPERHALSVSSKDIDKSCNLDAFRTFSHAIDERSHWRAPDDEQGNGMDEEGGHEG